MRMNIVCSLVGEKYPTDLLAPILPGTTGTTAALHSVKLWANGKTFFFILHSCCIRARITIANDHQCI